MSMTPITPGQYNPDPTEPDLGDLDAAFTRVFNTPPDDAPTVDLAAGESIVDDDSSTREEGGGEGGVSPVATPPATPPVSGEQPDGGGATDLTLPPLDTPQTDGVVIVDDSQAPPADPVDTPPAPPAPPSDDVDMTRLLENYLGRKPTVAEARDLLGLIDDLASGRAVVTSPQAMAPTPPAVQQPLPAQPAAQTPPAPQFDEWGMPIEPSPAPALPPEVAQELEDMKRWRQEQELAQQQQWQQWVASEQAAAAQEFTSAAPIPMSNEDLIALEIKASKSGVFALEYQRTQNPRAAWKAALEQTLYADPAFRDRVIEAQVQAQKVDNTVAENRTRLAASVSAGGGTAPGAIPTPIPSAPTNMGDAKAAATRDLTQIWEQS